MHTGTISVNSVKRLEFIDVTSQLGQEIAGLGQPSGVCYLYNPHTTAGVTINEGADPAVQEDLLAIFKRLAPESSAYRHQEGNSPAHVKASVIGSHLTVLVSKGRLVLGTWQGVFFCEFDGPRSRRMHVKVVPG